MKTNLLVLSVFSILLLPLLSTLIGADRKVLKQPEKIKEAELAIHRFKMPNGFRAELFAAEPLLSNPVAFCFDERGRIYVAETFRLHHGVEDNRGHMYWLLDDLSAQTVADRLAYMKKWRKDEIGKYAIEQERVRLIEDLDADGQADQSTIFADGFNAIEDGLGAGVLAHDGSVYFTCIPKLWRLRDTNGDGIADEKTPLHDGFGVRFAFTGHDLHGLVLGPDGRLYFSVGDRGLNVEVNGQKRLVLPDQGAVLRCELDGSELEIFCQGLRNPQELAFDDVGNLFTGDNNSDSGDRARWVYLPEGSDTGWRMYYQYHPERGPWNREKLWHLKHPGQAAYIVPPVAQIGSGPSGVAYYPGTGLDEKYERRFFLVDFRGQASNSGIRSFSLIPQGASFELVDSEEFIWSILATDVDFGFDGGIYVTDWVDGWGSNGQGRIYRFLDNRNSETATVKQIASLMQQGFDSRPDGELVDLLDHPDYRIRLRAQLALVKKNASQKLMIAALRGKSLRARIHAIWGVGQLARKKPERLDPLLPLLEDQDAEIRAQMARVCGDDRCVKAAAAIANLVKDSSPRVRSLAAVAVGRIGDKSAVPHLLEALAENGDSDPTLRHCLVMGLVGTASAEDLLATRRMTVPAIRLGAVVALRRMKHSGLASFVSDSDPFVVAEAVRAIHDLRITDALPAVAKLINQPTLPDHILRRAISANYLLGTRENAEAVAAFAGNPAAEDPLRLEALRELSDWNSPGPLDCVTNEYRPLANRMIKIDEVALPWVATLFQSQPKIQEATIELAVRHQMKDVEAFLVALVKDEKSGNSSIKMAALSGLSSIKSAQLPAVLDLALVDADSSVRMEARRLLAQVDIARAVKLFAEISPSAAIPEQQSAVRCLAQMKHADADALLIKWLDRLLIGKTAPAIQLDLLDAARDRGTQELLAKVTSFDGMRKADDHLKEYRETLAGGDVERGRVIFFEKGEVSCRRCHKIQGQGGEVGPDLSRIGQDKNREYLLESIVDPNKSIAKGFETVILQMADGKVYAGIIKQETEKSIQMIQPDGQLVSLDKSQVEERTAGKSGMPDDLVKKLTKYEVRDLVEYLSSLKTDGNKSAHGADKQ